MSTASAGGSRSRPQAARRRTNANDDASYFGPPPSATAGVKRPASDKPDGADSRAKRKRVEDTNGLSAKSASRAGNHGGSRTKAVSAPGHSNGNGYAAAGNTESDSLVDFTKMPISETYRYLAAYDLSPEVYPSPLSTSDPPPPIALTLAATGEHRYPPLGNSHPNANASSSYTRFPSHASTPDPTAPNSNSRLRSSRTSTRRRADEDEEMYALNRQPILADVGELKGVLAGIANRHFRSDTAAMGAAREFEVLAAFMCAVEKAKASR